ncbi:MAG: FKBP-type peptidyl-prolyl cis-trans isomerase [bacterium]
MKLKEKDFIEIEFTGKIKDTEEIFDSNIEKDIKKMNSNIKAKPFVFPLGQGMFLKGIDDFFTNNEMDFGKEYQIELDPEQAFGPRNSVLVQMIPMKIFNEQKLNPFPGAVFNFDGRIAKVLTVSGGRVMVDFNNPVAGKKVIYNVKVLRKLEDINEKIKALNEFLFKKDFKFEIKDKKIILNVEKQIIPLIELLKDKFKEILDLELEAKEISKENPKKEKSSDNSLKLPQ